MITHPGNEGFQVRHEHLLASSKPELDGWFSLAPIALHELHCCDNRGKYHGAALPNHVASLAEAASKHTPNSIVPVPPEVAEGLRPTDLVMADAYQAAEQADHVHACPSCEDEELWVAPS